MDTSASNTTGKKIVLADDEEFIVAAYKDGLEQAGYSVTVARDGAEALQAVKNVMPDLVLLDLIMPKLNGFEVLRAIKADDSTKHIPVIVLLNLSQPTDEAEARQTGALDAIVKADISLEDLTERIAKIFTA